MSNPHEQIVKHCPTCQEALEQGTAVLTSGMIPGAAYYCPRCRMLYMPDLEPLARMIG
jgi:hypothetical protein